MTLTKPLHQSDQLDSKRMTHVSNCKQGLTFPSKTSHMWFVTASLFPPTPIRFHGNEHLIARNCKDLEVCPSFAYYVLFTTPETKLWQTVSG